MSENGIVEPRHRDVARGLCALLAAVRGQIDDVMATPWPSTAERDRFDAAVLHASAAFLTRKLKDPESYLLSWISAELVLADAQDAGNGDGEHGNDVE